MDGMSPEQQQQQLMQAMYLRYLSEAPREELVKQFDPYADEGAMLQEQLASAQAFGRPSGYQYSTGAGAALGGAGDMIREIRGGRRAGEVRQQMADLLRRKQGGAADHLAAFPKWLADHRLKNAPGRSGDEGAVTGAVLGGWPTGGAMSKQMAIAQALRALRPPTDDESLGMSARPQLGASWPTGGR